MGFSRLETTEILSELIENSRTLRETLRTLITFLRF